MALLSWSDQYLIGNDIIDAEHKELFRLINDFHTHWVEAQDRQDIARVLNQLINYAQMHFQHEENIMETAGYPNLLQHQHIHEALIDVVEKQGGFSREVAEAYVEDLKKSKRYQRDVY